MSNERVTAERSDKKIECGWQLIEWAKEQCDKEGKPHLDCNILMFIREWRKP